MTTNQNELSAQYHWEFLRDLEQPGGMSPSLMRAGLEFGHLEREKQSQILAPEVGELAVSGASSAA